MEYNLTALKDLLSRILNETVQEIVQKNDITLSEVECVTQMLRLMEKIDKTSGYSTRNNRYNNNNSNRYYSGHSFKDRMLARLEGMYGETSSDYERQMIDSWINKMRNE